MARLSLIGALFAVGHAALGIALPLWPPPTSLVVQDASTASISAAFAVHLTGAGSGSGIAQRAVQRYQSIIAISTTPAGVTGAQLTDIEITVLSADETLDNATDVSYMLAFDLIVSPVAHATAVTPFGVGYALEALSQLVDGSGILPASALNITDSPQYSYRGLMLDSGRRFVPVPLLYDMIDAMSYSRMNVLHLHLADWAGCRIEVPAFPELTAGLNGQFYSAKDVAAVVDYARDRGVRVVPEIDVPGHASGLAPLTKYGLTFCTGEQRQVYNDPGGASLGVLSKLISYVATLFPDPAFHLGGDETVEAGPCTNASVHALQRALQQQLVAAGKRPVAWEEVFMVPAVTQPNAAEPGLTVVENWHRGSPALTAQFGLQSVTANYSKLYLSSDCCAVGGGNPRWECYYVDVRAPLVGQPAGVLGGEVAMWGDLYCPATRCPQPGVYAWMYGAEHDQQFSQSFSAMVWPHAAAAAAAFWNYQATLDPSSSAFQDAYTAHTARLIARGVGACPPGCACDFGHKCGTPYGPEPAIPLEIVIVNNSTQHMDVNAAKVCDGGTGATLAKLQPGQSYTARQNFIVESVGAAGDPWDLWVGDPTWRMVVNATLLVRPDPEVKSYLDYVQIGGQP